jgi:pseudaminic acid synthase
LKTKKIQINERSIGAKYPPYIVAEISANHNGNLHRALDFISMSKKMGADAVKLQTYTADSMTINSDKSDFQIKAGLWEGYNLYELYELAQTPYHWHKTMFDYASKIGITCFSTPFDESAVDFLEDLNSPAYKIASFEAVDLNLISYVAQTKKPVIISTGMANLIEIEEAVETAQENGCEDLILLHCISSYPAPVDQSNLLTIVDLSKRFKVLTGLSDHTLGTAVSVASIALGACLIEKHVTMSRNDKGVDSEFSLEPHELKTLCSDTNDAWKSLGVAGYDRKSVEENSIKFRRSLYAVKDIQIGEKFTEKNIKRIRPGFGLSPKYFDKVIGRRASVSIKKGEPIIWSLVDNGIL